MRLNQVRDSFSTLNSSLRISELQQEFVESDRFVRKSQLHFHLLCISVHTCSRVPGCFQSSSKSCNAQFSRIAYARENSLDVQPLRRHRPHEPSRLSASS